MPLIIEMLSPGGGRSYNPNLDLGTLHIRFKSMNQSIIISSIQRNKVDLKLGAGIFFTCLLVYVLVWSGHHYSIDGIVMFQSAKALLFDHSFLMDPPVLWGEDFYVSKWPIGLTLVYLPILAVLASTVFHNDPVIKEIPYDPKLKFNPELLGNRPYLYSSPINLLLTATTAVALYTFCIHMGMSRKRSAAAALIFGLASPALPYAKYDFAQPLASLLFLGTLILLLRARKTAKFSWYTVGSGTFMGLAILTRPEFVVLAAILVVAIHFLPDINHQELNAGTYTRQKNLIGFALPVLMLLVINQWINSVRFATWLAVGYHPMAEFGINPVQLLVAILGHLISPGRGLLFFFPICLLGLFGLRILLKRDNWFAYTLLALFAGGWLLYSLWKDWGAGLSWGPRFLMPFLPILTYLAVLGFDRLDESHRAIKLLVICLLISLGALASLQGALFNFLDFHPQVKISSSLAIYGIRHFLPNASPLLAGWDGILNPTGYDIFWLKPSVIEATGGISLLVLFSGLILMGVGIKTWFDYFYRHADACCDHDR